MTTNEQRPYAEIVEQLQDSETWPETSFEDVEQVAVVYTMGELRLQMHLHLAGNAAFSPMIALSAMTALHLDNLVHLEKARLRSGL